MTAVQWLVEEFKTYLPSIHQKGLLDAFEQAKEMEKQQIIDAHENGYKMGEHIYSEQYYNDKFNK